MSRFPPCSCGLPEGLTGLPHNTGCPYYTLDESGSDLAKLIDMLKKARGDHFSWSRRQGVLIEFTAALPDIMRMFCRGEVHLPDGYHHPAILVYNSLEDTVQAWVPSAEQDKMTSCDPRYFSSTIPHVAIAREVLDENRSTI